MGSSHQPQVSTERLEAIWAQNGWPNRVLLLLAGFYQWGVALRRMAYVRGYLRTETLPVPVVVVGNVLAGGAGKTPTVIALVGHLRQKGWHVGVISRGYGRSRRDSQLVHDNSHAQDVGDEPLLVYHRCHVPVAVARRRIDAARLLLQAHPGTNLLICDDGLQHLALARDLDIVVFDDRGVGNGRLIPAGWLREPWPRPANLILHTGSHPTDVGATGFTGKRQLATLLRNGHGDTCQMQSLAALANGPVYALAAIAHPQRFFSMLRQQGLTLQGTQSLPDHADLAQWQPPTDWANSGAVQILCTEKDAYKIWIHHPSVWAVRLDFEPEPAFFSQLDQSLANLPGKRCGKSI